MENWWEQTLYRLNGREIAECIESQCLCVNASVKMNPLLHLETCGGIGENLLPYVLTPVSAPRGGLIHSGISNEQCWI